MRPRAEIRWVWRRLFVFSTSGIIWTTLYQVLRRVPAEHLPELAQGLMSLLALVIVLYLVAPSAEQVITFVAQLKLRFGGRP